MKIDLIVVIIVALILFTVWVIFVDYTENNYASGQFDDCSANRILSGWYYHNQDLPAAFGTFSIGDKVALFCWQYLYLLKNGNETTIKTYCSKIDKKYREPLEKILTDVVELYKEKLGCKCE